MLQNKNELSRRLMGPLIRLENDRRIYHTQAVRYWPAICCVICGNRSPWVWLPFLIVSNNAPSPPFLSTAGVRNARVSVLLPFWFSEHPHCSILFVLGYRLGGKWNPWCWNPNASQQSVWLSKTDIWKKQLNFFFLPQRRQTQNLSLPQRDCCVRNRVQGSVCRAQWDMTPAAVLWGVFSSRGRGGDTPWGSPHHGIVFYTISSVLQRQTILLLRQSGKTT